MSPRVLSLRFAPAHDPLFYPLFSRTSGTRCPGGAHAPAQRPIASLRGSHRHLPYFTHVNVRKRNGMKSNIRSESNNNNKTESLYLTHAAHRYLRGGEPSPLTCRTRPPAGSARPGPARCPPARGPSRSASAPPAPAATCSRGAGPGGRGDAGGGPGPLSAGLSHT